MNRWRVAVLVVAVLLLCGAQAKADSTIVLTFEALETLCPSGIITMAERAAIWESLWPGVAGGGIGIEWGRAAILRMPLQATR